MSRTIKSLIKEFYEKRDPRDKDYAVIDDAWLANAANTTGSDITKTRALDILNDARMALYAEFEKIYPPQQLEIELSGIIKSVAIVWTFATPISTAPKPTDGYLKLASMYNQDGVKLVRKTLNLVPVVLRGDNKHFVQSASKIFIFEEDTRFIHYGTFIPTSATGVVYTIRYYRLAPWTVANMEAGVLTETINDQHHTLLMQIMLMFSNQYGARDVEAFIRRYTGAK